MISDGKTAPGFRLAGRDGAVTTLDELLDGGGVMVAFYKISCPTCQLTMPYLDRLAGGSGGWRVVGISQNSAGDTGAFEKRFGIERLRSLIDDESTGFGTGKAYGITHVPSVFVIDAGGTVARSWSGFSRADLEYAGELVGAEPFEPGEEVPNFKAG